MFAQRSIRLKWSAFLWGVVLLPNIPFARAEVSAPVELSSGGTLCKRWTVREGGPELALYAWFEAPPPFIPLKPPPLKPRIRVFAGQKLALEILGADELPNFRSDACANMTADNFDDVDFDGYKDLVLANTLGTHAGDVRIFRYKPKGQIFIELRAMEQTVNFYVDKRAKQLVTGDAKFCEGLWRRYRWKNGKLQLFQIEETNYGPAKKGEGKGNPLAFACVTETFEAKHVKREKACERNTENESMPRFAACVLPSEEEKIDGTTGECAGVEEAGRCREDEEFQLAADGESAERVITKLERISAKRDVLCEDEQGSGNGIECQ